MELYLIRHAQSFNNTLADMRDRVEDPPLTELAHEQAQLVAAHLAQGHNPRHSPGGSAEESDSGEQQGYGLTRLYCSAMWRALQTTEPISKALGLTPAVWLDIHERGGIFLDHQDGRGPQGYAGKTRSEILARFPHYHLPDEVTEEGWWNKPFEDRPGCDGRALRVAHQLRRMADGPAQTERIGLVTHGGFMDALIKALLGQLPTTRFFYHHNNTAITRLDFRDNGVIGVRYINQLAHLPAELVT